MIHSKLFLFVLSIVLLVSNIRNVIISEVSVGQFACFFVAMVSGMYAVMYLYEMVRRYIGYRHRRHYEAG